MAMYRWNGDVLTEWKILQDNMDFKKKEWDSFMKTGNLCMDSNLSLEISSSWRRCRDQGLDPYDDVAKVLRTEELKERQGRYKKIIDAIRPVLQETADEIIDSGYQIDFYDKDLYLLMRFGKKIQSGDSERRIVSLGESSNEKDVGTTSTNLSALLGRPIQLIAFEHYRTLYHDLTSCSVPLMNQEGKLIAILTIEGWCWPLHKHTMGLLVALKHCIENRLSQNVRRDLEFPAVINRKLIEMFDYPVVIVDSNGKITLSNEKADKTINAGWKSVIGFSTETIWGPRNPFSEVLKSKRAISNREIILEIGSSSKNFIATISPLVGNDGKPEGAVGIFKESGKQNTNEKRRHNRAYYTFDNIVGESHAIKKAIQLARETSRMHNNVLIQGESGTGKEIFAQAIHNESPYRDGPFVVVNCSAIPHALLESELFGYESGAFTGAKKDGSTGKFEQAAGGTIFLDEINSMSLDMQAKILRVIQNKSITRIAGNGEIPVDVRIIAATNVDLWQLVKKEEFREDLYYRINVIAVQIPPLRERVGDVELIIDYLIFKMSNQLKQQVEIDQAAINLLKNYSWPGNVRELENVLERSWVHARTNGSDTITLKEVCSYRGIEECEDQLQNAEISEKATKISPKMFNKAESEIIYKALESNKGNIFATANQLGIARNTLYRRMKKYGIEIDK